MRDYPEPTLYVPQARKKGKRKAQAKSSANEEEALMLGSGLDPIMESMQERLDYIMHHNQFIIIWQSQMHIYMGHQSVYQG